MQVCLKGMFRSKDSVVSNINETAGFTYSCVVDPSFFINGKVKVSSKGCLVCFSFYYYSYYSYKKNYIFVLCK